MKAVELGKVAAAAEALRLRRQLLRYSRQAAFLVVAALFGLFALVSVHLVIWTLCYGPFGITKVWSSVILLGFDVVVAGLLLMLGRGRLPDPIEVEARITRDRSLSELRSALAFTAVTTTLAGPAGRMAGRTAWGVFRKLLPGRRRR